MKTVFLTFVALALLGACNSVQLSSGADYVAQRPTSIDADIRQIAAVEPDLVFPAKIGLARIVNGRLTQPSAHELSEFGELTKRKAHLGQFVAISPFAAELAAARVEGTDRRSVLRRVRQAAAVQHVDYVLIYEIGARSSVYNTPFALADITIIGGALLPTRNIAVAGTGSAAFVDVRNGYPYAMMQAEVDLSGLSRSFGASGNESRRLQAKAIEQVATALVPEFEEALTTLERSR